MSAGGWLRLYRQALENGWLRHHERWAFWSYCLLKATHTQTIVKVGLQDVHLEPGQFVFGRKKAAEDLGLSEKQIRGLLSYLISANNLTIKATNKFSVISIVNWHSYQGCADRKDQQRGQQKDRQGANKGPTKDHIQEVKEVKKLETLSASLDAEPELTQDFYLTAKKRKLSGERLATFNQFMDVFKDKRGRAQAADSWFDIKPLTRSLFDQIIQGAKIYAEERPRLIAERRTPKMAQGWLSLRRWEDEPLPAPESAPEQPATVASAKALESAEKRKRILAQYDN